MEIVKIEPTGWCNGIKNIFNEIKKITSKNKNVKLYCFKELVHNKATNDLLKDYNIKVIKSLSEIKDKKNSIVLLQAHGTTQEMFKTLKTKHIKYIDLSCKFVLANQTRILDWIKHGYSVAFFGHKNHQETKAVLSLDKKRIYLINADDLRKGKAITIRDHSIITTQTTEHVLFPINDDLEKQQVSFTSGACPEIVKRQSNLRNKIESLDVLIVIGDKDSNNTINLVKIGKENKIETHLVQSIGQLKRIKFDWKNKVGICSGASTPKDQFDLIYNKLVSIANQYGNKSIKN